MGDHILWAIAQFGMAYKANSDLWYLPRRSTPPHILENERTSIKLSTHLTAQYPHPTTTQTMTVSSTSAAPPDDPSAPTALFSDRSQPLEGLPHDRETTKSYYKSHAQGVYRPPHMRAPSESVAPITGSNPMASGTSAVHPEHGSSLDRKGKGVFRSRTPHNGSVSASDTFGFGEIKKRIHDELLNVRRTMEDMETLEKEFLMEEAHFEQRMQVLRSAGLTDEEIREIVDWNPADFLSGPPTVKPLDVNVGICLHILVLGRGLTPGSIERGDRPGIR